MFTKLSELLKRYEYLSEQLADASVIADMPTWQRYSKEQSDLTETAEVYKTYLATEKEMQDAFEAAELETDSELKKMLTDEGYACKERLQTLEGELKILLLPKDKNDDRSCILEVRAGTGGEEAALFAGVLCRMYANYCASHRLKMEEIDVSATELGGIKEAVYNVTGAGAEQIDLVGDGLQGAAPEGLIGQIDTGHLGGILSGGHSGGKQQLLVLWYKSSAFLFVLGVQAASE